MTSRPVLIAFSILAGLDVILGGVALIEIVDPKIVGAATLLQAGFAVGLSYYVQGRVAPWSSVAAQERSDGTIVAGPAAPGMTKVGTPVDVLRDPTTEA